MGHRLGVQPLTRLPPALATGVRDDRHQLQRTGQGAFGRPRPRTELLDGGQCNVVCCLGLVGAEQDVAEVPPGRRRPDRVVGLLGRPQRTVGRQQRQVGAARAPAVGPQEEVQVGRTSQNLPCFLRVPAALLERRLDVDDEVGQDGRGVGVPGSARLPDLPGGLDPFPQDDRCRRGPVPAVGVPEAMSDGMKVSRDDSGCGAGGPPPSSASTGTCNSRATLTSTSRAGVFNPRSIRDR